MAKTGLIILNYNNCTDTRNCIESVLKHNTAEIKFIIVDNASNPNERESLKQTMHEIFGEDMGIANNGSLRKELPYATLLLNNENSGYARGNNLGLEMAYADPEIDTVMILNNDILFTQDIIPELLLRLNTLDSCAIVSPLLYKPGETEYDYNCARLNERITQMIRKNFLHYWWKYKKKEVTEIFRSRYLLRSVPQKHENMEIELPSGSCMLIKKNLFQEIGSFDPNTFLYYEENILYSKLKARGLKNYLCLDQRCIHLGAATTKKSSSKSTLTMRESLKSQWYYARHYSNANYLSLIGLRLSQWFFLASITLQKALKREHQKITKS